MEETKIDKWLVLIGWLAIAALLVPLSVVVAFVTIAAPTPHNLITAVWLAAAIGGSILVVSKQIKYKYFM